MKTDMLLLTVLYAVACSAFIGAINARGPARVALSWFLAILTLCAAVFHTSQMLAGGDLGKGDVVVAPPPPPEPVKPPEPPPPDTAAINASSRDAAVAEGKGELRGVLESARRTARNLASLNLGGVADISDEEYEALQNRAIGYLSEARKNKEKLASASAKIPPQLKEAQDLLARGIDALVTAAYNAERFFKSENDTEEKQHAGAFRRASQEANSAFRKAGDLVGAQDSDD